MGLKYLYSYNLNYIPFLHQLGIVQLPGREWAGLMYELYLIVEKSF